MNRILNWFRLRRLEDDLDRELQYHIDSRVADLIHSGLTEPDARRRAALELGGVTQVREEVRDVWLNGWLRDFVYDLRFSVRSLLRSPVFTATAVLSIALGIGATTALYSLLDQIVLRALPVDQPERLVLFDWIGFQYAETLGTDNLMSYPICRDLQQQKEFFDGVFCRAATTINFSTGGEPRLTAAELVSGTYFSVLGVRPALGRLLTIDDDQTPAAKPVRRRAGYRGPKGVGESTPYDGCRRCCADVSWHRRGGSPIRLDSSRDVGSGNTRIRDDARSSYALGADPGQAKAERLIGAGSDCIATLV
jgi:hypothetical protein